MGDTRAGFVCLIGAPNAGKSTLLNQMVGVKIAGVTHKVQTTRARLRGIAHHLDTQMVFVDTPGIFAPKKDFEKAMVGDAWAGVDEADIVLLMVDVRRNLRCGAPDICKHISGMGKNARKKTRFALVLNKIDRVASEKFLEVSAALNALYGFEKTFMISARRSYGMGALKDWLAQNLPPSPWLYDKAQIADSAMDKIATDITREKILLHLHHEIPYQLTVEPQSWEPKADGSVRVEQVIYVARVGHRGIILGRGGKVLKAISQSARADIGEILGVNVHLFLRVKHVADWENKKAHYDAAGLDFSKRAR